MNAVRKKLPTIMDVAKSAGVSRPTVSRVLTGATPVSDATRLRVSNAMKELGYRPNGAARALSLGQQPIIGVITGDTASWGRTVMLANIERKARAAGYFMAITILDPADIGSATLDVLLSQPLVGVIVLDFDTYDTKLLREILGAIPVATVTGRNDVEVPHVVMDDRLAARQITQHLLSLGHETVHHVAVPGAKGAPHARELGWLDALHEAGARVPEPQRTDWSLEESRAAGRRLSQDPSVTAVFCSNDEMAFGVMKSLHEAGKRVPEDVSVAGLDDEPLASAWVPGLTTFQMDWPWAGATVFDLLADSSVESHKSGERSSGLVVRGSTARLHA